MGHSDCSLKVINFLVEVIKIYVVFIYEKTRKMEENVFSMQLACFLVSMQKLLKYFCEVELY